MKHCPTLPGYTTLHCQDTLPYTAILHCPTLPGHTIIYCPTLPWYTALHCQDTLPYTALNFQDTLPYTARTHYHTLPLTARIHWPKLSFFVLLYYTSLQYCSSQQYQTITNLSKPQKTIQGFSTIYSVNYSKTTSYHQHYHALPYISLCCSTLHYTIFTTLLSFPHISLSVINLTKLYRPEMAKKRDDSLVTLLHCGINRLFWLKGEATLP